MTDIKNDTMNENKSLKESPSLEEQFASIEEIIGKMEVGEATLDETFDLYKKGLEKIKEANALLDDMEKAMLIMNEDGSLEEF
jgi:exodeoxyribonuclease VII small subunit